jgi:hypothetical protein
MYWGVSSFCSTSGTRRVTIVSQAMKSLEWGTHCAYNLEIMYMKYIRHFALVSSAMKSHEWGVNVICKLCTWNARFLYSSLFLLLYFFYLAIVLSVDLRFPITTLNLVLSSFLKGHAQCVLLNQCTLVGLRFMNEEKICKLCTWTALFILKTVQQYLIQL